MQPMTIGPLLRQLRQDACRSQSEQASILSELSGRAVTRNEVSRWESETRVITPYWQEHIARSFHMPAAELNQAVVATKRQRRLSNADAATSERSDVERRAFMGTLTGLAVSVPTLGLTTARRLGAEDVRRMLSRTARLRRLDDLLGGADTYRIYARELATTTRLIKEASLAEPVRRMLATVLAEQAQLTGWAAFDAGMQQEARKHYLTSYEAANEARDSPLAGNALAFLAYQEVSVGKPDAHMANASLVTAQADATPRVRALLLERLAWTYAVAGQASDADRALKMAEDAVLTSDGRPEPDWVFWVDSDEIRIMAGRCWTELRRPLRAVPILEDVLDRYSDTHARDKSMYLTWLARSYLEAGEIEKSAQVLLRSVALASGIGSTRPAERIQGVLRGLRKYRDATEVATVFDAAASLT